MYIIYDSPGQTCNRLWSYLDMVGYCIIKNKKIFVLFFEPDIKYFDNLLNSKHIVFPFYNKYLINLLGYKLYKIILDKIFANRICRMFYKSKIAARMGFMSGWKNRDSHNYFPLCRDKIQELYMPCIDIVKEVHKLIMPYKSKDEKLIIGVHIRRGDYRRWMGGKYFFTNEEYFNMMEQLQKIYKNKKLYFFISTNEQLDWSFFSHFNILKNNGTAIHDLYALSLCDRIIGPLSTFSRWASFYGNVPLCFMEHEKEFYKDEDFSVITDFYHFDNGKEIINLTDINS